MSATLSNGVEIPLNVTGTGPFFGQMGVAPPPELGEQSSILPGVYGGNLDNKRLGPGATLYIPVNVPGRVGTFHHVMLQSEHGSM